MNGMNNPIVKPETLIGKVIGANDLITWEEIDIGCNWLARSWDFCIFQTIYYKSNIMWKLIDLLGQKIYAYA